MKEKPSRALSLTRAHVAHVHREVAEGPDPPHLQRMTEADHAALADALLAENAGRPFWVLAYGSLIWKPAFDHVEMRQCRVPGWRRSFCLNLSGWRATPEEPGLMLALDRGGSCRGVAYRMPEDDPHGRMLRLVQRETGYHGDHAWQRWLTVEAGGERLRALAFWCAPRMPERDLVRLPIEAQARRIARAVGHMGSCAEYLLNTVEHLEALGIRDSYLWQLQELVAAEIEGM